MVMGVGVAPTMCLTSRVYSPLPSLLGYPTIKREVVELFHNVVRIVNRRVMLMVFDRDTFTIHINLEVTSLLRYLSDSGF